MDHVPARIRSGETGTTYAPTSRDLRLSWVSYGDSAHPSHEEAFHSGLLAVDPREAVGILTKRWPRRLPTLIAGLAIALFQGLLPLTFIANLDEIIYIPKYLQKF